MSNYPSRFQVGYEAGQADAAEAHATFFRQGFVHGRGHEQLERERIAELHKPFPGNPPELLKPTRCKVLRPFSVAGRRVEPDQVLELPRFDAESMRALGRVQIIEG
jgi:hypothetical protein